MHRTVGCKNVSERFCVQKNTNTRCASVDATPRWFPSLLSLKGPLISQTCKILEKQADVQDVDEIIHAAFGETRR